ncbi:MAG: hypothetical protein AAGA35_00645 [Patescibacteria group bacterium]
MAEKIPSSLDGAINYLAEAMTTPALYGATIYYGPGILGESFTEAFSGTGSWWTLAEQTAAVGMIASSAVK